MKPNQPVVKQWNLAEDDPVAIEVAGRAMKLNVPSNPEQAVDSLGTIRLSNSKQVNAFVVYAIDPVITDGKEVVVITRRFPPGEGKPALPGGFIDPNTGGAVTAVPVTRREALKEAGVTLPKQGRLVGERLLNRPHDVRVASNDALSMYGIQKSDIFMVSTQAVRFDVPDLKETKLKAGDDTEPDSAKRMSVDELMQSEMAVKDHPDIIRSAFPEKFKNTNWAQKVSENTPNSNQLER